MFTPLSSRPTDPTVHSRPPMYEETVLEDMIKEQDSNQSDKELNLFPTLQRIDSLSENVKLLMKKLEQIKDHVKELKKGILNEI